jgi:hypothetical protein
VVAATSPITFAAGTVAFDQSANNTTNDTRYARLGAANAFTADGQTILTASPAVTVGQMISVGQSSNTSNRFGVNGFGITTIRTSTIFGSNAALSVGSGAAANQGIVVRGVASQTANLQEWQNSAGSILGSVAANGDINTTGFFRLAGDAILGRENGGTALRMIKATSTPGNLSTGVARLYFRDGTTVGTLKLVVKAAAGAETTILDNIPQ